MAKDSKMEAAGTIPPKGFVRVRAMQDDIVLDPAVGRVKRGAVQQMDRQNAEYWATRGLLEILPD